MKLDLRNGSIDARQGYIGGWKITSSTLEAGNIVLKSEGSIYGGPAGNAWYIDKDGNASFNNLSAAKGFIGPFVVTDEALTYKSGSTFTLNSDGLNLNGNFIVNRNGEATINGSLTINGDLVVTGKAYLKVEGTGSIGESGYLSPSGGTSDFYGFGNKEAHIGPWIIDENSIRTDYSELGAGGTLKLQNSSQNGVEIFENYSHLHYGENSIYTDSSSCKMTYGGLTNSATYVYIDAEKV